MLEKKTDNPLKYDIHPLDFIKKKTIADVYDTLNIAENVLSSWEKIHRDSLDEAYGGSVDQAQKLDEFRREFWGWCFPW